MSAVRFEPQKPTWTPRTDDPMAASRRRTLIDVALGTIVGFGAWFLSIVVLAIVAGALLNRGARDLPTSVTMLVTMGVGFVAGIGFVKRRIAARVRRAAYHRRVAVARGECPRCEYSLRGLPEPRCPECGEQFTELEFADLKENHPATSGPHDVGPARPTLPSVAAD